MNNREAFEVMRRDKLEELLDEYFDLAVEKGRNFERNGLRSNQVRKEILSLFDLASQAQQTESQEASDTKNAERKNWTTKDWMSHVGAWETDRDTIEFGSIMAVNAMLIQFQQFMLWQIEQQEQKSLCEYKTLLSDIQGLINSSEGVAGLHKNGEVATWDWLINSEWLSLPAPEGEKE